MVKVIFITSGANSLFGGFAPGDALRCSEAMAAHLVGDIKCARYADTPPKSVEETVSHAPNRGRKTKQG